MKPKEILAFIGLSFSFGSSFLWIKIALEEVGPFMLVAFRVLFGIIGLLIVVAITRPEWPKERKFWLALALLGFTNTAIPFVLISWGEQFIDSGVASILNSSMPLYTVVIAHFFLDDDKLTWGRGFSILLGFAGVYLILGRDIGDGVQNSVLGQAAVILAAMLYAFSSVFARRTTKGVSSIIQALVPLFFADAVLWTLTPLVESPLVLPTLTITWIALLWLGLIGSCIAYLLYFYMIHAVGPTRVSMVTYTFPVIGVALGVIFLGEVIDAQLIAGGALVLVSIVVVNLKK